MGGTKLFYSCKNVIKNMYKSYCKFKLLKKEDGPYFRCGVLKTFLEYV